ncbi:MAG: helix-hairpin-helix domain-containing protein [Clostridia bacterium]|nr:helix-hairpin-helix domain-containing protein [Clostridia bacterium]
MENQIQKYLMIPALLGLLSCYFWGLNLWQNRVDGTLNQEINDLPVFSEQSEPKEEVKINLNTATKEELMTLSGVGEKIAERILEKRETLGGFHSVEQITEIQGIGEKLFEQIQPHITIE